MNIDFIKNKLSKKYSLEVIKTHNIKEGIFVRPICKPETTNISIKVVKTGMFVKSFSDKHKSEFFPYSPREHRKLSRFEQAKYIFATLPDNLDTEYTKRKGINTKSLKRIQNIKRDGDKLVLGLKSLEDNTKLINFQFCSNTSKWYFDFKEEKRLSLSGAFAVIQEATSALKVYYVVEGIATGLTVAEALPEAGVIVALTDHNSVKVSQYLKNGALGIGNSSKYGDYLIITCGEKNKEGENHKVYSRQNNLLTVYPEFQAVAGTDFNDLASCEGIKEVRHQLLTANFGRTLCTPLGISVALDTVRYKVFSNRANSIINLPDDLTKNTASLFTSDFLQKHFSQEILIKEEKTKWIMNALKLHRYVTDCCLLLGSAYSNYKVTYGIRKINKSLIFNSGKNLFLLKDKKFKKINYNARLTKVFKSSVMNFENFEDVVPWTNEKAVKLTNELNRIDYKEPHSAIIMLGFLAQAILRGISVWGGNIHVGGGSSTGKSTHKRMLIKPLAPSNKIAYYLDGVDTSRQATQRDLNGACSLVVAEELESKDASDSSIRKMSSIIELVREGTEGIDNVTVKIDNGEPKHFLKCFSFLSMSIMHNVSKQQDYNRFIFVDFERKEKPKYDNWAVLEDSISNLTNENSLGFSKKVLLDAERFLGVVAGILEFLKVTYPKQNDHKHRNLANCLGGFTLLAGLKDDYFCSAGRVKTFEWVYKQYKHDKEDDKVDFVEELLGLSVPIGLLGNHTMTNFAFACQNFGSYAGATNILKANKIKFDKEENKLYFRPKESVFKQLLKHNKGVINDVTETLRNAKNVTSVRYRIDNTQIRGYCIDLDNYPLYIQSEEII